MWVEHGVGGGVRGVKYRTDTPPTNQPVIIFFEDGRPREIEDHHPYMEARWAGMNYAAIDGPGIGKIDVLGWLPRSEIRDIARQRRAEYEALPGISRRQKYVASMTERCVKATDARRVA